MYLNCLKRIISFGTKLVNGDPVLEDRILAIGQNDLADGRDPVDGDVAPCR